MSRFSYKKFLANIWEVAEVVIIALVTVFVIRTFIAQPFLVSGASMEPSFDDGDYLLIDEVTYYFREPARGDVVVFRYPSNPKSFFIKRVIALPGETIKIAENKVTITPPDTEEAFDLDESYLSIAELTKNEQERALGPDEYFVMGDNRDNSFDSRAWGPLELNNIIGLDRLRIFPIKNFEIISSEEVVKNYAN